MFCTKIASFCWLNYEITSSAYICSLTHIMYLKESNVLHALGECRISYNPVDCPSIKIHKMHMLYVYKMLFPGSFYKELDWPSIKCPSRAPYLIIIGGILCQMWLTMLGKESAFYRGKLGQS